MQETIGLSLHFTNFDKIKIEEYFSEFRENALSFLFNDKVNRLKQLATNGQRILIIIDNYHASPVQQIQTEDDDFKTFISGDYDIMFTSRERHDYPSIEIEPMSEEDLKIMFAKYYGSKLNEKDVICNIISLVYGHTITLMLIATGMSKSGIPPIEMLKLLENGLTPNLCREIKIDKEGLTRSQRTQVMEEHLRTLFDLTSIQLNKNYKHIMTNMTLVSNKGIEKESFFTWALQEKCISINDLDWLVDRRWIQLRDERNTQYISLHTVISDIVNRELNPNSEKCRSFLLNMISSTDKSFDETHHEVSIAANMMQTACERITDASDITAGLYYRFARLVSFLAKFDIAMTYYKKAAEISNHANAYNSVAYVYHKQGDYPQALIWFKKALSIVDMSQEEQLAATICNGIAGVYNAQGDNSTALKWYEDSLAICKNVLGEEHPDTAMTINNIAGAYLDQKNYDLAMEWYNKSLEIIQKVPDVSCRAMASAYGNIALVHCYKGEYVQALEFNLKALEIRERVYGLDHPETALSYNNIGLVYSYQGDQHNALIWYNKALSIYKDVLGEKHHMTISVCKNIFNLYMS